MIKKPFMNFMVDHMTFLVAPRHYKVTYALFRIVLGVSPEDVVYEKRRKWPGEPVEQSMTFASRVGRAESAAAAGPTIIAVVQPTEPETQSSHVREILKNRGGTAHWQHIALRTPDLLAFHRHALAHGVNFITPIMKDADEDLIQVFSGEWNLPRTAPTGIFFEFVQRRPAQALLKKLDRQAFFKDKTFLGLYGKKEAEYRSGKVVPFIDEALFEKIEDILGPKHLWDITAKDLKTVAAAMKAYARGRQGRSAP